VLGAALGVACAAAKPGAPTAAPPPASPAAAYARDPAALARGELLLQSVCSAYCHALPADSASVREAPSLFDCAWLHGGSDAEIFHTLTAGVPNTRMVSFAGAMPAGDADLWRIVAYLRASSRCGR
jgi:mono/diheme cytochrome c family protein